MYRGGVFLARWTTEFDKSPHSEWYYIIKDTPFDISTLKAKRRYEITKGIRNFTFRKINPADYADAIYHVLEEAYNVYPTRYRPKLTEERKNNITKWDTLSNNVFGLFDKNNNLVSFIVVGNSGTHYNLNVLKTIPSVEKYHANAAILYHMLMFYGDELKYKYISNGERTINHETNFNDYLIKYFGFKKVYATLHLKYFFPINIIIAMSYPWRNIIKKIPFSIVQNFYRILMMEEIVRNKKDSFYER